jgi:hypothetical protein
MQVAWHEVPGQREDSGPVPEGRLIRSIPPGLLSGENCLPNKGIPGNQLILSSRLLSITAYVCVVYILGNRL